MCCAGNRWLFWDSAPFLCSGVGPGMQSLGVDGDIAYGVSVELSIWELCALGASLPRRICRGPLAPLVRGVSRVFLIYLHQLLN